MSDDPKSTVTRLFCAAALAVSAVVGAEGAAAASTAPVLATASVAPISQGSVSSEVARYATDPDGLLLRLDDLFGVTTSGVGIAFDDTTGVGQLNRAWVFTEAWLDGGSTDTPVELANLWSAPITIADKPVGLATIWINPETDGPDLADFDRAASSGAALLEVPAEVQLVRDEPRGAWLTLLDGELSALIIGTSGVTGPIALDDYRELVSAPAPVPPSGPEFNGLLLAGIVVGTAGLVVLLVLLLPMLSRRAGERDPDAGLLDTAAVPVQAAPTPKPEPEPEPPAPEPAKKPATKKPASAKPAIAKPIAAKPTSPAKPTTARKKPPTP